MGSERGAAPDSRGGMDLMVIEGALVINPTNPSGPFSGSHPWPTSLVWEETNFWRKLWVQSSPKCAHEQAVLVYDPRPRGTAIAHTYM